MSKNRFFHLSGLSIGDKKWFRRLLPHVVAVVVFLAVAVIYCKPAFDGKVLYQEDVLQWQGMAQNSFQFRDTHGHLPLWTNGMFCGMPAYQIAMDGDVINIQAALYQFLTLFLIKPASFFFLAAVCFYFLSCVLRVNSYIGIIGGLAFAFGTYNPVIISAGHETKMQSIALLPALLGSLVLIFEKRYWQGMALTALLGAMLVFFGHMQIVYYGLIAAGCMFGAYAIRWIRQGELRHLRRVTFITLGAALIGLLCNAILLFITYDSSKETVRGGSELADNQSNYTAGGLSEAAAFDFSMYKTEPLVMMVPYCYGGTTDLILPAERSKAVRVLAKMPPDLSKLIGDEGPKYYWGGIGDLVSGPAYAGAIICFLGFLAFFLLDNKHKWWILSACVLTIAMSWGSYFQSFNGLLLKFLPGYNKFRAPSMIIVIPTFLLCILAVLTLEKIRQLGDRADLWRRYRRGLLLTLGVFAGIALLYLRSDFSSAKDGVLVQEAAAQGKAAVLLMQDYTDGLRSDRQDLFRASTLRSLYYILGAALIMGVFIKRRMPPAVLVCAVGVLVMTDLLTEDWKYLNYDDYNEKSTYQENFVASAADKVILQDTGYFRVFDLRDSVGNALNYGAMTAYFHRSIGGYHAAKLRIYEDLIGHQLINYPHCQPVIDMLNTKYLIKPGLRPAAGGGKVDSVRGGGSGDDAAAGNAGGDVGKAGGAGGKAVVNARGDVAHAGGAGGKSGTAVAGTDVKSGTAGGVIVAGQDSVIVNPGALGPAWFVKAVRYGQDAKAVMNELTHFSPRDTAILFAADQGKILITKDPDPSATLTMIKNDNDIINYVSDSKTPQFAVFSEIFYKRGWRACIDDFSHEVPIVRTNYALRGLSVPAGRHVIRFVFRPKAFYVGRQVQWMASIVLILLLIGAGMVSLHAKGLHIRIWGRHVLNFPAENLSST